MTRRRCRGEPGDDRELKRLIGERSRRETLIASIPAASAIMARDPEPEFRHRPLSCLQGDESLASPPFGMALRALMARFKMAAVDKV